MTSIGSRSFQVAPRSPSQSLILHSAAFPIHFQSISNPFPISIKTNRNSRPASSSSQSTGTATQDGIGWPIQIQHPQRCMMHIHLKIVHEEVDITQLMYEDGIIVRPGRCRGVDGRGSGGARAPPAAAPAPTRQRREGHRNGNCYGRICQIHCQFPSSNQMK